MGSVSAARTTNPSPEPHLWPLLAFTPLPPRLMKQPSKPVFLPRSRQNSGWLALPRPVPPQTASQPRAKLTAAERDHLVATQGCFYCRKSHAGHVVKDCPLRTARQATLSAVAATPVLDSLDFEELNRYDSPPPIPHAAIANLSSIGSSVVDREKVDGDVNKPPAIPALPDHFPRFSFHGTVLGRPITFLLDTGCSGNVVSTSLVRSGYALPSPTIPRYPRTTYRV